MNAFDDPYNSHSFAKMKMNSDSLFFQNYENNIYVEDQSELELLGLDNNMAQEDLLDLFNPLSHIKTAQALNAENDKLKKQVYVDQIHCQVKLLTYCIVNFINKNWKSHMKTIINISTLTLLKNQ